MSEWWSYRLSSFLLFSERTYRRLFELYNAEVWPAQLAAFALGAGLLALAIARPAWAARAAFAILGACWLWVATVFLARHYATINWAAPWLAVAFGVQGALLFGAAAGASDARLRAPRSARGAIGLGLLLAALLLHPLLAPLAQRPWQGAEIFGLAPDPTVAGTLAVLVLVQVGRAGSAGRPTRVLALLLWPIPLAAALASGLVLAAMGSLQAAWLPLAALLALGSVIRRDARGDASALG